MAKPNNPDRGLEQIGDHWQARLMVQGERIRSPLFKTKTQARTWYDQKKTQARMGEWIPTYRLTVKAGIDKYLEACRWKKDYKGEVSLGKFWKEQYPTRQLASLTPAQLEADRQYLLTVGRVKNKVQAPCSPTRVNRHTEMLNRVFRFHRMGANPVAKLKKYPEPKGQRLPFSDKEKVAILKALGTQGAIFRLALLTGMRRGEQFTLTKSMIQWQQKAVILPKTKSGRAKVIPLVKEAVSILKAQCGRFPRSPWVYPSSTNLNKPMDMVNWYKRIFVPACQQAKVSPGKTWHSARHTWATTFLEETGDPKLTQLAGGWSSLQGVDPYLHIASSRIREGMKKVERRTPK